MMFLYDVLYYSSTWNKAIRVVSETRFIAGSVSQYWKNDHNQSRLHVELYVFIKKSNLPPGIGILCKYWNVINLRNFWKVPLIMKMAR